MQVISNLILSSNSKNKLSNNTPTIPEEDSIYEYDSIADLIDSSILDYIDKLDNENNDLRNTTQQQLPDDTDSTGDNESYELSCYWDTTSQLTSFHELDDDKEKNHHVVPLLQNDQSHIDTNSACTKIHQVSFEDDIKKQQISIGSTDNSNNNKFVVSNFQYHNEEDTEEETDMGSIATAASSTRFQYMNDKQYSSVFDEVLQNLENMDKVGDLPSFNNNHTHIFEITPDSPTSSNSSIFSNQNLERITGNMQTPDSTTSSKFTHQQQFDTPNEKKPSRGTRLLRKLSMNFSNSSLSILHHRHQQQQEENKVNSPLLKKNSTKSISSFEKDKIVQRSSSTLTTKSNSSSTKDNVVQRSSSTLTDKSKSSSTKDNVVQRSSSTLTTKSSLKKKHSISSSLDPPFVASSTTNEPSGLSRGGSSSCESRKAVERSTSSTLTPLRKSSLSSSNSDKQSSFSNKLKHRLSNISLHDTPQQQIHHQISMTPVRETTPSPQPLELKKRQSMISMRRSASTTAINMGNNNNKKKKIIQVRSVSNLQQAANHELYYSSRQFAGYGYDSISSIVATTTPAPPVTTVVATTVLLKSIEDTISLKGGDADPDYLEFKKKFLSTKEDDQRSSQHEASSGITELMLPIEETTV